jgi:uracil-DNA glycosylase
MPNTRLAKLLTDKLPSGRRTLFNPWRDRCDEDEPCNGPDEKLARLAAHLACNPKFILCGEAPSYRGCRHSGIAFTSEHLLLEGRIPGISRVSQRLTIKKGPYKEGSATTVWNVMYDLGIEKRTILWNALQLHPHERGNIHSNRKPSLAEVKEFGKPALQVLRQEFPSAIVVAVGRTAEGLLKSMDIPYEPVRHPARGGAKIFAQQLKRIVARANRGWAASARLPGSESLHALSLGSFERPLVYRLPN